MACEPQTYDNGHQPAYTATFVDDDGLAADPDSLTVTLTDPTGTDTGYTEASPEVTNPATGSWRWEATAPLTVAGRYRLRWAATGAGRVDVDVAAFTVLTV